MSDNTQDPFQFRRHAARIINLLRADIMNGCKLDLAVSMALLRFNGLAHGAQALQNKIPLDWKKKRIAQALAIAVGHYEKPEVIAEIGNAKASCIRAEYIELLSDHDQN